MFKTIFVALKFTGSGLNALRTAAEIARTHHAGLHIFNALDYHLKGKPEDDPELAKDLAASQRLFEEKAKGLADGLEFTYDSRPADPSVEIGRIAKEVGADLLVIGCHQESGRSTHRVDYTGMTIIQTCSCPILLVPYQEGCQG